MRLCGSAKIFVAFGSSLASVLGLRSGQLPVWVSRLSEEVTAFDIAENRERQKSFDV
jgi:hypothetical protein